MGAQLLEQVRRQSGLTQAEVAARAGTSRTTLSAYEHGRKSPTLSTVERVLDGIGYELSFEARVAFTERTRRRGRPVFVPNRLWRLAISEAFATIALPLELNWSTPGTTFDLADRRQRARCYEVVIREGLPADILRYIDGALLVDLWPEIVLPRDIRAEWQLLLVGSPTPPPTSRAAQGALKA
jgi:transcriptional regulator with XRE-family HTH domain